MPVTAAFLLAANAAPNYGQDNMASGMLPSHMTSLGHFQIRPSQSADCCHYRLIKAEVPGPQTGQISLPRVRSPVSTSGHFRGQQGQHAYPNAVLLAAGELFISFLCGHSTGGVNGLGGETLTRHSLAQEAKCRAALLRAMHLASFSLSLSCPFCERMCPI